ncbi:MAG: hypothetical protein RJQ09_19920 [Cyclobacteriaceae bacterium]
MNKLILVRVICILILVSFGCSNTSSYEDDQRKTAFRKAFKEFSNEQAEKYASFDSGTDGYQTLFDNIADTTLGSDSVKRRAVANFMELEGKKMERLSELIEIQFKKTRDFDFKKMQDSLFRELEVHPFIVQLYKSSRNDDRRKYMEEVMMPKLQALLKKYNIDSAEFREVMEFYKTYQ